MSWQLLVQLLVQFGPKAFDLAEQLIAKWNSTDPVTQADIDALRKLGQRTAKDAVVEALVRNGIALDSPQGVAILALVP